MKLINGVEVRDTLEELIAPAHTALVVVDVQNDFCHPDGHFARHGKNIDTITGMLPALVPFVNAAQDMGIFTVFVQQLTLPHGRSDSPAWLRLKCRDGKSPEYTMVGSWGAQLVDGLQPRAGDVMVQKFRPDAFVRTPLDGILRAQGIESLVIVGTTTEGCVESTVRGASYHDYYVIPVTDLITGPIAQLHANSLAFMRARYPAAESAQVLQTWRAARGAAAA
ncbi:isochorismatase family protein [Bordetella bronchiseptica SBL-F6116]|uniref:cysteine hydrolase family protein n=1 Tax=Bordetella bronchiseptica TaxID=518 RepID=UPI000459E371|nr:cysteine hydrolase [Bordetella bronchiseptica]KCV24696.1 isochorismatase family protein [Bordetella bronchiseptica 00-P-2730]KDD96005.1 isochorismatase family protein [Bordetella bronchiseptica SBL-F6116]